jgi:hypothetical protein
MRAPNQRQLERPWRIHDIVADFDLEDVWSLSDITGSAEDFSGAIHLVTTDDPTRSANLPARLLWKARDLLGRWFDLGGISVPADSAGGLPIPGTTETTLRVRLPDELRGTADDVRFEHLPFSPLYKTADEFAAEVSNKTVHGVLHLAWVPQDDGTYRGQLAVYVKPRGPFGSAYMAFIKPFRYLIIYPALERQLARTWADRGAGNGCP